MSDVEKAMGDGSVANSSIAPAAPSSTPDPHYPGVGIKYPDVNPKGKRNSRNKANRINRIKNRKAGVSADANNSVGAFASGGSGGSMGTSKSDNIWSGSVFKDNSCTDMTPKCTDIMCKACMNKSMVPDTLKRDFNSKQRERLASTGAAMPDGSYPISNRTDLENAIRSWGRGGARADVKAHIISRARALGASA